MQGAGRPVRALVRPGSIAILALPLAAAAVYVLVLGLGFTQIVDGISWSPDFDSHMVMAEWLGVMPKSGRAILAESGYLWFDLATRPLPGHREIWLYAPYAMALVTLGLLSWCSLRLAGAWAAAMTIALGIAASPVVLTSQVAQALHGSTWFGAALLAALLVGLITTPAASGRLWVAAAAGFVAVIVGAALASDPLLGVTGVAPFGLAGLAVACLGCAPALRRAGRVAVATAALSIAIAAAVAVGTRAAGYASTIPHGFSVLVPRDHVLLNLGLLFGGVIRVGNGGAPAGAGPLEAIAALACGALILVAAVLPWLILAWWLVQRRRNSLNWSAPVLPYLMFWALSELCLAAAFVLSDIPVDFGASSARYLVPFFYVAAALVPPLAARSEPGRVLAAAAIALFCLTGARVLQLEVAAGAFLPGSARGLPEVTAFLEANRLSRGYSTYWDASPMTWQSGGAVQVRPVTEEPVSRDETCGPLLPGNLCPFTVNSISDWYRPQSGVRSFVLVDPAVRYLTKAPSLDFGVPIAAYQVDRFTIYVYADDIGARLRLPRKFTR